MTDPHEPGKVKVPRYNWESSAFSRHQFRVVVGEAESIYLQQLQQITIPTHPGEVLLEEFLNPMGLTQRELADAIHVPYQRINDIVNGRRGITPSTALRLAKFFNMSADFWMNVQLRWDMYFAQKNEITVLETIQPLPMVAG